MDLKTFELFARYNVWSTQKLNQALKNVSDEDFNVEYGLFFKTISGTLNHLLVGEHYLWFPRFSLKPSPLQQLNTIVERDKDKLMFELESRAHHWIDFLKHVDVEKFGHDLHYKTSAGLEMSLPYAATLLHVFNHATHHRGQVTAALTSMGYPCPEIDMVYMLIEDRQ